MVTCVPAIGCFISHRSQKAHSKFNSTLIMTKTHMPYESTHASVRLLFNSVISQLPQPSSGGFPFLNFEGNSDPKIDNARNWILFSMHPTPRKITDVWLTILGAVPFAVHPAHGHCLGRVSAGSPTNKRNKTWLGKKWVEIFFADFLIFGKLAHVLFLYDQFSPQPDGTYSHIIPPGFPWPVSADLRPHSSIFCFWGAKISASSANFGANSKSCPPQPAVF